MERTNPRFAQRTSQNADKSQVFSCVNHFLFLQSVHPSRTPKLQRCFMKRMQQSWSSAITVFIAESSHLNCQLLASAFGRKSRGIAILGSDIEASRALAFIDERQPHVAVISAQLQSGPLDGYRLLSDLRSARCSTRAILLLDSRDRNLVIDAFRCGARGVIFRDERIETLRRCIRAVHQGQVWANSEQLQHLLDALCHSISPGFRENARLDLLSKRQVDVVRLVAQGMTNRDVAAQLGLSEHTIRNYLFEIFNRIGVSTRVELVRFFLYNEQAERLAG
jgi:two-component system nitrate/nitrite response regulator NarL